MEKKSIKAGFSIVVADRGWVYVGDIEHDGEWCIVTNAKNIRRWGTSYGLGEIAESGPTSETVLDNYGTVSIPAASIVCIIDTVRDKWTL